MTPPAPTTLTSFREIQDGADTMPRRRGSNEIEIKSGEQRDAKEDSSRENDSVAVVGASRVALVGENSGEEPPKEWWGARHTLALMGFLGFTVLSAVRICLSITIVAMVKSDAKNSTGRNATFDTCPFPDDYEVVETSRNEAGEFAWDEATQGRILSAFFYGYISTNLLAGRAAEHFGGKLVFGLGYSVSGVLTALSPWLARRSTGALVGARVLVGAGVGVSFPAMTTLLASWIPPDERGKFVTLVYNGIDFGNVLALVASGWLCDVEILGGWPLVSYVFGGLALVWTFVWLLVISDLPEKHPRISAAEKAYVMQRCGVTREKPLPIPWRAIMTSLPVWAIMVVQAGNNWGFFTLLTEMPTYLKNMLHFDMRSNGVLSAFPYMVLWVFSLTYVAIIELILTRVRVPVLVIRRISMAIASYGRMLGLLALCFVDCDSTLALVALCLSVGFGGSIYYGYMCSHQDLAPNFAGFLMGMSTTMGNIPGLVAPQLSGLIISGNQTLAAWRVVFIISSAMFLVSGTFFLVFITAEKQPWNDVTEAEGEQANAQPDSVEKNSRKGDETGV